MTVGWASEALRKKPVEKASHDETDNDERENDDQTSVKHETRHEATGGNLVDVAGIITCFDAWYGGLEVCTIVE